jgi:pSer/pThr/pTyr-binding forkhead associated (FHA) protein
MKLILHIIDASSLKPSFVSSITLDKEGATLGRNEGNTIVLPDSTKWISGKHAIIEYHSPDYYLTDNSANGLLINNWPIPLGFGYRFKLSDGDSFKIGEYLILVKLLIKPEQTEDTEVFGEKNDDYSGYVGGMKETANDPFEDFASPSNWENLAESSKDTEPDSADFDVLLSSEFGSFHAAPAMFPEAETPRKHKPEQVEFTVFSPTTLLPCSTFCLDVWAYLPSEYSNVIELQKSLDRTNLLARKLGVPLEKGAILVIRIEIPGFKIQEPIDTIIWNETATNASFLVDIPNNIKTGNYPGKVVIQFQGISIAKVTFIINIASTANSNYINYPTTLRYPQSAFASYASENREEVLSRIQGMKKIVPNLDVFIDLFSLRSGEDWQAKLEEHVPTKDIFYLFWSKFAASSAWVEREWRLALDRRGISYIDPVPLDEPDKASPPQELNSLHFSDAYLTYIKYEELKKRGKVQ